MIKPSIPQGTRDFAPQVVRRRQFILRTIASVFENHGFQPLETPAMENLDTLLGKYGDEGDKLIFRILNNGLDNPAKRSQSLEAFEQVLNGQGSKTLTERALRYDLTIPFARFVAMNHGQLSFPFKRYQMQPVWRADRPQKGRYREFWQCDADVVGSPSLLNEAELIMIYREAFQRLGISVDVKLNNRKILAALAESCHAADKMTDITVAIDKLDKIGIDKVMEELEQRGLDTNHRESIKSYLLIDGSTDQRIDHIEQLLGHTESGKQGILELRWLADFLRDKAGNYPFTIDFTLARGLNYYTGTILEVKALDVKMGSIGGGGRYDDLTGLFGVPGIPGVGVSFGVDRIYDVMEETGAFPTSISVGTKVLFFNLGQEESRYAWAAMQQLRAADIACEIYPESVKFDRQFKYAEKKGIPNVIIAGSEEMSKGVYRIKNLSAGTQIECDLAGLYSILSAEG
jgi:histidyl-tRNA synthetase